jgi:hypothetical protein
MAPEAVAARSSSANNVAVTATGSTIEEVVVASNSIEEGTAISKALAAGRMVAARSKEVVTPQIATDFFDLLKIAVFTFCSPSFNL